LLTQEIRSQSQEGRCYTYRGTARSKEDTKLAVKTIDMAVEYQAGGEQPRTANPVRVTERLGRSDV